jgi:hypothetical protein
MIPAVQARKLDFLAARLRAKAAHLRKSGKPIKVMLGGRAHTLDALTSLHLDADAKAFERDAQKLRTIYA